MTISKNQFLRDEFINELLKLVLALQTEPQTKNALVIQYVTEQKIWQENVYPAMLKYSEDLSKRIQENVD